MKLYYSKPETLSAAISGERRGIVNREILFRAKRIGDGKWFEGYYCGGTEDKTISPCIFEYLGGMKGYDYHNIILDTLGQYTGMKDIHGVKIFEGDIVNYNGSCHKVVFESRNGTGYFGIVVGENETWGFGHSTPAYMMAVVGNIYDNPELLEVNDNG